MQLLLKQLPHRRAGENVLGAFTTARARADKSSLDPGKGDRIQSYNLSQDLVMLTCSCWIQKYNIFFPLLNRLCSSQLLHLLPFSTTLAVGYNNITVELSAANSLPLVAFF